MEFVWQSSGSTARKRTRQDKYRCLSEEGRHLTLERGSGAAESSREAQSGSSTRASSPRLTRVGEYIPESVLEDLSSVSETSPERLESHPTHSRPALALARHPREQAAIAALRARRQSAWYKTYKRRTAAPGLSESHQRYLQDVGAFLELPKTTTDALLPIYISVLDDLMPLLDGASVFRHHSNGHSSTFFLVRAICLVTCKTKQAAPFLRLTDDGPILSPLQFASKLYEGLDAAMKADIEPDRITKIQVLALMHLHNDGLFGMDRSSKNLSHAIHEAWSLSLQWNLVDNKDQEQSDYLWWTLRNLDRLNKPVMGATPFLIDDTDISIARIAPKKESYRSQVVHVSLALGDLVAQATKVYKGNRTAVGDDDTPFPSFAEITSGVDFDRFHRSHREYLEIWYHVASMLSCRYSGPGTTHYNRRLNSADGVLVIFSKEDHDDSTPLPLIPYSISLCTCTIYRALRDGIRDTHAAYTDLKRCCKILDSLSSRWTITKGMVKLANRLCRMPRSLPEQSLGDGVQLTQGCPQDNVVGNDPGRGSHELSQGAELPPMMGDLGLANPMLPTPDQLVQDFPYESLSLPESEQRPWEVPVEAYDGSDELFYQFESFFPGMFEYGLPDAI